MKQRLLATGLILALCSAASEGWAWGATGHEWISGIAIEKLPDTVPEFIRTPQAAAEMAVLGRELDRSKGAGKTHDSERDSGHYVDLADDGSVMGVVPLAKLPTTREEYDTLLRAKGFTQYKAVREGQSASRPELFPAGCTCGQQGGGRAGCGG